MAKTTAKSGGTFGGISSEAVSAATGKTWRQWCALLDKAGGRSMNHKEIVGVVRDAHGVGPWWQQMVTVGYEQAAGLRKKHQKPSGFEISRAKTLTAPATKVFAAWKSAKLRAAWLGNEAITVRKATASRSLRITWSDGATNLDVMLYPKGAGKTQITVQHGKLASAKQATSMKAYWGKALNRLATVLES